VKTREKVELTLIPLTVLAVGWSAPRLPARLSLGEIVVIGCLGWLVQGGLRDLWLLYLTKRDASSVPRRRVPCMCLESSAGLTGVLVGIVLAGSGIGGEWAMNAGRWMMLAAATLTVGFVAKDYVVSWNPLGIRREPDHHTFIFAWKAGK
jgi:hypothetical protein